MIAMALNKLEESIVVHLAAMRERAEREGTMRCIEGEVMLYWPAERALVPGHIYSDLGMAEAKISHCCEYHFDRMFKAGWTDPISGQPGLMPPEEDEPPPGEEQWQPSR